MYINSNMSSSCQYYRVLEWNCIVGGDDIGDDDDDGIAVQWAHQSA